MIFKKLKNDDNPAVSVPIGERIRFIIEKCRKPARIASFVIPALIFAAVIGITSYYIFFASQGEFHADCTDTIMWAAASHDSGHVYDENFGYACFLPFGINLIMQPLISIFDVSLTTHHLGMLGFMILLMLFFCLMLREMHIDIRKICLSASVFLSLTLSSQKLREIFWGHTIYYTLGVLFIVIGMFLYCRLVNLNERKLRLPKDDKAAKNLSIHYIVTLVILCIFIMLTATDGISSLSIFALPFIAGIFAEQVLNSESKLICKKSGRTLLRLIVFFVMVFVGGKLNEFWKGDLVAGYQDGYSVFSAMSSWVDNAQNIPISWLSLFGVQDLGGTKLFEVDGVINLIYLINALVIAVIPVIATCYYPKYEKNGKGSMLRIFIWLHWAVTAIIFIGCICGVIGNANWRLTPILGTSVITSILFVIWAVSGKKPVRRITVILSIPVIAASVLNLKTVAAMPSDNYKDNVLFSISQCLEEQNLTYGYATFWNANSVTVISGSEVKVRCVDVTENGVTEPFYQCSREWYDDQEGQQEYFLLLSQGEYDMVTQYAGHLIAGAKNHINPVINNIPYYILVFDYNIMK
ncbi:MAG: hypothetical protein ACI4JB_11625 [Porcipelethomonas sp.]